MKRIAVVTLAILAVALLFGCATPEERARFRAQQDAAAQSVQHATSNRSEMVCLARGLQRGTENFSACVTLQNEEIERCARVRNALQTQYFTNLNREGSRPGARFLDSTQRATAQTPNAAQFGC